VFRAVGDELWVFDIEWVPDPVTGRRAYGLPAAMPDADVVAHMFVAAGATPENPRPFIKTALCRVVSISAIKRRATGSHPVRLELRSMPEAGESPLDEAELISKFLESAGKVKPQLVGFNITGADLPILIQRAMAHGVAAPAFCQRPEKPWQGVDYFGGRGSDAVVELMDVHGTWGRGTPSLHELASAAGIPGKLDTAGEQVVDLWLAGDMRRIVEYNEFDVITTYLIWLRTAHLGGFVSTAAFGAEERQLEALLRERIAAGAPHLERYLDHWRAARAPLETGG
jgi:predicted PolB exonuclease-like 3'-5' exonuclease